MSTATTKTTQYLTIIDSPDEPFGPRFVVFRGERDAAHLVAARERVRIGEPAGDAQSDWVYVVEANGAGQA